MNKMKLCAVALALASSSSIAGTMGNVVIPEKLLFIEAGIAYSHAFYKDSYVSPESRTSTFPNGVAINPNDFYPDNFFGGYIGSSLYMSNWLLNTRYDMYGSENKFNRTGGVSISLAPAKLSFTLDRVWGDINQFSYGLGGGAIVETTNDGIYITNETDPNAHALSESIQGKTRIDPLVEGFLMYRFENNFGVKFNAGYQIPVNSPFGQGDLNLNLGINYAFPV